MVIRYYYDAYETADGKYLSIGAIEPQFFAELLRLTGLDKSEAFQIQNDQSRWPRLKEKMDEHFRTKTRDQWCTLLEGSDACFAPVMSLDEASAHPHNVARKAFVTVNGLEQPAPAPRYSKSTLDAPTQTVSGLNAVRSVLADVGYSDVRLEHLYAQGVIS